MTNYIMENERRVIDLGREKGERRRALEVANQNLANSKQKLRNAFIGLVAAFLFAAAVMSPFLTDNAEVSAFVWGK